MGIFKNLRKKLLKKKLNERYGMMVYADTDSVKVVTLNTELSNCINCIYAVKLTNNWICAESASVIDPTTKMCDKGVKRFDNFVEISNAKMGNKKSLDVPTYL